MGGEGWCTSGRCKKISTSPDVKGGSRWEWAGLWRPLPVEGWQRLHVVVLESHMAIENERNIGEGILHSGELKVVET